MTKNSSRLQFKKKFKIHWFILKTTSTNLTRDPHCDRQLPLDGTVVVHPVAGQHHQHQLHALAPPQAGHTVLGAFTGQGHATVGRSGLLRLGKELVGGRKKSC